MPCAGNSSRSSESHPGSGSHKSLSVNHYWPMSSKRPQSWGTPINAAITPPARHTRQTHPGGDAGPHWPRAVSLPWINPLPDFPYSSCEDYDPIAVGLPRTGQNRGFLKPELRLDAARIVVLGYVKALYFVSHLIINAFFRANRGFYASFARFF